MTRVKRASNHRNNYFLVRGFLSPSTHAAKANRKYRGPLRTITTESRVRYGLQLAAPVYMLEHVSWLFCGWCAGRVSAMFMFAVQEASDLLRQWMNGVTNSSMSIRANDIRQQSGDFSAVLRANRRKKKLARNRDTFMNNVYRI